MHEWMDEQMNQEMHSIPKLYKYNPETSGIIQ